MANSASSPCATRILCGCLAFAFPAYLFTSMLDIYVRVTCSPSPSRASPVTSTASPAGDVACEASRQTILESPPRDLPQRNATAITQRTKVKSVRSGVTFITQRPWPLVKGNGFILVSECLPGTILVPLPGHFASKDSNLNGVRWCH
jgi:hypothetical protein